MDDLIAAGVDAFLSAGFAGCLDDSIGTGEFVVPDRSIRDEGTSHRYVDPEWDARPSGSLVAATRDVPPTTNRSTSDSRGPPGRPAGNAIYRWNATPTEASSPSRWRRRCSRSPHTAGSTRRRRSGPVTTSVPPTGSRTFHLARGDLRRLGDAAERVLRTCVD